ncbi:MAG: hypothetical protein ABEJ95_05455 [Candidatus Nanohalobium sp.]
MTDVLEFVRRVDEDGVKPEELSSEEQVVLSRCEIDGEILVELDHNGVFTPTARGKQFLNDHDQTDLQEESNEIQEKSLFWQRITSSISLGRVIGGVIIFILGVLAGGVL